MKLFMIDEMQLNFLKRSQKRLIDEKSMTFDERRDIAKGLNNIVRVAEQMEIPGSKSSRDRRQRKRTASRRDERAPERSRMGDLGVAQQIGPHEYAFRLKGEAIIFAEVLRYNGFRAIRNGRKVSTRAPRSEIEWADGNATKYGWRWHARN